VLGDLAQATGLWSYATWHEVAGHLGLEDFEPEEPIHAYRVPREIMEVALPVLALTAPSITPPRPFRPGGRPPTFVEVPREGRAAAAVEAAQSARESDGTAAIIAPGSLLEGLRSELAARHVEYGDAEQGELTSVELLDPRASKGLEFDHVVLVEPASIIREAEGEGQRDLYVALTRATRTLTCIHAEPLPWPLGDQDLGRPAPQARVTELDEAPEPEPAPAPEHEPASAPEHEPGVEEEAEGPLSEAPVAVEQGAASAMPPISIGEALVLARIRGMSIPEALARALLTEARGAAEAEVATAILDPETVDDEAVEALLKGVGAVLESGT
jgi:hypothetical protein